MAVKKAFKCGRTVVMPIPRAFREALHIVPGTQLVVTLKDKALHVTRAIVLSESAMGAPEADSPAAAARKEPL